MVVIVSIILIILLLLVYLAIGIGIACAYEKAHKKGSSDTALFIITLIWPIYLIYVLIAGIVYLCKLVQTDEFISALKEVFRDENFQL